MDRLTAAFNAIEERVQKIMRQNGGVFADPLDHLARYEQATRGRAEATTLATQINVDPKGPVDIGNGRVQHSFDVVLPTEANSVRAVDQGQLHRPPQRTHKLRSESRFTPADLAGMLVFTRKRSQSIIIGDGNIKITLEGIRNGKSLLDIEVPDDMKIGFGKLDEETNFPKRDRLGAYIVTQLEPGSAQFDLEKDGVIIINGKIAVKVVEMRGDKVRLGIEAPREVPIHRQEVWEAIQAEGRTGEPPDSGSASEI